MYIASFYRFTNIVELKHVHQCVEELCIQHSLKGTVILANEGINAVIAHPHMNVLATVFAQLETIADLNNIDPTITRNHQNSVPFDKLLVKIRSEIVTYGVEFDFTLPKLPRVDADQWASLVRQDETVVLDVRNRFEHALGRFQHSVQPNTKNFREFNEFLESQTEIVHDQTVAIYCTGGIRCEKAAQSMHKRGFKSVVQLNRGILGYFEEGKDLCLWDGECFVFDQRVAVNRELMEGDAELCIACGQPLSLEDRQHPAFQHSISCPACFVSLSSENITRRMERLRQRELTRMRQEHRLQHADSTSLGLCG